MRSRRWLVLAGLATAMAVGACSEDLEGGGACPVLCPQQNVVVLDTIYDAVTLDSSLIAYPPFGTEPSLLVSRRGDTLDTRAVIRYDSLVATYFPTGTTTPTAIDAIDSAYLRLIIDRTRSEYSQPLTLEVFNVDTLEPDTVTSLELPLFRPDRRVGAATFDSAQIKDTLIVRLDSAVVMSAIKDRIRLRLGLKVTSSASVMLQVRSNEAGAPASILYDASPVANEGLTTVTPNSTLPVNPVVKPDYYDYILVAKAPAVPSGPVLPLGGTPGRRVYLRFNVPSHILDSSTVLRATLLLTQQPNRAIDVTEAMTLYPQMVTAGSEVSDVARQALLVAPAGIGFDTLRVAPGDSGAVNIDIVNALRTWALPFASKAQRAIVLRTPDEAIDPRQLVFFSSEAPPAVRPRLRISYSPRTTFGVP